MRRPADHLELRYAPTNCDPCRTHCVWSELTFRTPPTTPRPTRIAYVADQGTFIPLGFAVIQQEADDDAKLPYDFLLHGGDVAYGGTGAVIEDESIWDMYLDLTQAMAGHMPCVPPLS